MAIRINKAEQHLTYKYIPIAERAEKDPFTVEIRRLTAREFTQIEDNVFKFNKDESVSFTTGSFNWEVCRKGIIDWANMLDERNREIRPKRTENGLDDESLNLLPLSYITEIANVIAGITKDPSNTKFYLGKEVDEQ